MQIDTGADHTIMCKFTYIREFSYIPLKQSQVRLTIYTGDNLKVCGEILCEVVYTGQKEILPIIVVDCPEKPTLLGRNWLKKLKLNW